MPSQIYQFFRTMLWDTCGWNRWSSRYNYPSDHYQLSQLAFTCTVIMYWSKTDLYERIFQLHYLFLTICQGWICKAPLLSSLWLKRPFVSLSGCFPGCQNAADFATTFIYNV